MDKKVLKWNMIFQYGWVLTNIFNSIILLPVYLHHIDMDTLGVWLATGSILTWMTLADPGVGDVLQQKIAEARGKKMNGEVGHLIGSGYLASGFILLISVIVGLVCYSFIGVIINKQVENYPYLPMALLLSVIATGLSLVSFSVSGINQGLHNSTPVAVSAITANFLFLFVNLVFLYLGYGVLSIALANLFRATYIIVFNVLAMRGILKRESITVDYQWAHFKRFSRIFSFTSASKIISGLSYSVDLLVLARFISPAMITVYEINKRPINITSSLIGRHSVALMPLVSHAKGRDDRQSIMQLISQHSRFYCYAALFVVFIFCFNYKELITAWTGPGKFGGNVLLYFLTANLFFGLLSYFMSNMGYALGDIKRNSVFNIVRGCVYGVLMFFSAKYYGIIGTLVTALAVTILADLVFYSYRLRTMGYLTMRMVKNTFSPWVTLVPVCATAGIVLRFTVTQLIPPEMNIVKLIINSGVFTAIFFVSLLLVDKQLRTFFYKIKSKYISMPLRKVMSLRLR